jgi:hypothetical protein
MVISCAPTVWFSGAGAGVDKVWEQEKPEARKMLENAAESPPSTARFVGQVLILMAYVITIKLIKDKRINRTFFSIYFS